MARQRNERVAGIAKDYGVDERTVRTWRAKGFPLSSEVKLAERVYRLGGKGRDRALEILGEAGKFEIPGPRP